MPKISNLPKIEIGLPLPGNPITPLSFLDLLPPKIYTKKNFFKIKNKSHTLKLSVKEALGLILSKYLKINKL
jgi:hypothetical protein